MNKLSILSIAAVLLFSISACEKEEEDKLNDGTELQQSVAEGALFFQETEQLFNDVSNALSGSGIGKNGNVDGANVNDSSFILIKRIVISYTGNTADGIRFRLGTAVLQLVEGEKWSDAGAVVQVDLNNVRITNRRNNNQLTVQGTYYVKNTTGGRAFTTNNVQHKVWGNVSVSFGSGAEAQWQFNRRRTILNTDGLFSISTQGDTTFDGRQNVHTWGTNRRQRTFWITTQESVSWSSACLGKLTGGKLTYNGLDAEIIVTHGVNENGTPTNTGCPFGYKVQWQNSKGEDKQAIISY
jgi:hypothetical protein